MHIWLSHEDRCGHLTQKKINSLLAPLFGHVIGSKIRAHLIPYFTIGLLPTPNSSASQNAR